MRNTKRAFTLVELIVVITILAILGTIAFISLQGYSQEARNSKVTSDLRNLVTAIETDAARNGTNLLDMVTGSAPDNEITGGATVGSGQTATGSSYLVGNVNLAAIGQGSEDFKDPNSNDADYLMSAVAVNGFGGYQVAGQLVVEGTKSARILGNYYPVNTSAWDDAGLFTAASGDDTATPLTDGATITGTDANLY